MYKRKKPRKALWLILLVFCIILLGVIIGAAVFFIWPEEEKPDFYQTDASGVVEQPSDNATATSESNVPTEPTPTTEEQLPDNPIDFEALQKTNPDAYAWICVPGTKVDYPILQAAADAEEDYYLHRNLEGDYEFRGSVYTQKINSKDFTDPVTVIYGHHMLDESMFSTLYYFRDEKFFAENDVFYIYTPGHILTYRIVSAYRYDSRHILNSFDFSDEKVLQEYIDFILSPMSMVAAVREGVAVTTEDHIVTLSTCIDYGTARYLVQGVLTQDERTN